MEKDPGYPPGGVVYKLSEKHVEEALSTGLLGMPDVAWSFVQRIQKGTPVFLYDEDRRVVHGIFEAKSPGTFNFNRLAYHGTWQGSPLPCQVQVKLHYRYEPASVSEFDSVPGLVLKGSKIKLVLSKAQVNQMYGIFNHILERQQREEQQSSLSSGICLPFLPLPPPVQPAIPPAWTGSPSSNSMALPGFPPPNHVRSSSGQNVGGGRKPPPRGPARQSALPQRGSKLRPQMPGSSSSGPDRGGSVARAPITGQSHRPQGQLPPPANKGAKRKRLDEGSKTTVVLNNLPGELTIEMAIADLDAHGFYGAYDFFYFIPTGPKKVGCIIINLVDHNLAEAIFEEIDAITAHWPPFRRPPKPPVGWARQQGLSELHAMYPQAPTRDEYPSEWCIKPRVPTFFDLSRAAEAARAPPRAFGGGMPVLLPRDYFGFALEEELLLPPHVMPAYARMPAPMMALHADSVLPWAGKNGRTIGVVAGMKQPHAPSTGQGAKKRPRSRGPVQTVQPVAAPARTAKHTAPAQQKKSGQPGSQPQSQSKQGGSGSLTQRLHSALGSKPSAATAASAPPKQPGSQPQSQSEQRQLDSLTQRLHSALGSKPTAASAPEQPVRSPQKQRLKPATGREPQQRYTTAAQQQLLTANSHALASAAADTAKSDAARDVRAAASLQTPEAAAEARQPAAQESARPTSSDTGKPRQSEPDSQKSSPHSPAKGQDGAKVAGSAPQSKAGARAAVHVRAEGRATKHAPIVWNHEQAAANAAKVRAQPGSTSQPPGSEAGGAVGGGAPSRSHQPASELEQGSQQGAAGELEHASCVQKLPHSASEGQKGAGSPESVPLAMVTGQGIGTLGCMAIEQQSQDRLQQDVSQEAAFDYGANFVEI